ncbi:MAG TPA: MarR family transcriptional regulator [Polyangia bacterium]|nr:MarR family transcriptional regulator [Polyangia bacterium]
MKKRAPAPPPLPSRLPSPAASPGFLLWKVSNAWQRRQRATLEPLGLTHSQFVLLATATWFGASETLTQARLAELSGVDPMTTSQVVRTLELARLVERRSHPADPRAKAVAVTEAGRAKARQAVVAVEETDDAFFAPLRAHTPRLVDMFGALVAAEAARSATSRAGAVQPNARAGRRAKRKK